MSGAKTLTFPPELERYLPPHVWRKLADGVPPRGVLLNTLDRLRSLLYLLSTYLPRHLVQEKMRRPTPGLVRGQMQSGSLLFTDVSGFTALSERLAVLGQEGAEQLTDLMNGYFERMIEILAWSGGILLKFAGDALLAYFPEQEDGEQARWAVRAGQRMMDAIADFAAIETPLGTVSLRMKIGIGTGDYLAASVGSAQRMEYVVLGETVTRTMAAEGVAEAEQVIVDEPTAASLDPSWCVQQAPGYYAVGRDPTQDLGEFEIKAERRRARGAIPWSASPHAIAVQMEVALRQIQTLTPYLSAELVDRIVARARQRRVEGEFRPTTVLFMNFIGLESLLTSGQDAARGARAVRLVTRLLDDYFQAMHEVIVRHGGVVSRIDPYSQGSKMLVLFGAPVAHEDDPQRAVSAALAMNEKLAALTDYWRYKLARRLPPGMDAALLQQRMGITQGPTLAGQAGAATRREYTVMGDDVNLAARLMSAAQPGQILVSQRVYDAVVNRFLANALPAIRAKGKSQPIPIYQPVELRDDPLARRLRSRGTLVGRTDELERGWSVVRQAIEGQGTIFTIQGPPGVGKSHLADTLAAHALARGVEVLFSECRAYAADAAYAPWIDVVHATAGIVPADPAHTRREKLFHALADLDLAEKYAEPLAALLGLPGGRSPVVARQRAAAPRPEGALFAQLEQKVTPRAAARKEEGLDLWQLVRERQRVQPGHTWQNLQARVTARQQERLFEAVCELLESLAAGAPVMLFFESSQWMDPASRELLGYLGERLHRLPILVMVVQRGVVEEGVEGSAFGGTTLTLEPWALEGTLALVGHLWGEVSGEADLARAIHKHSGGNPLFIEEIVGWMLRTGHKTAEELAGKLQASALLQELVLSHLDGLPQGQRDLVRAAAVVGDEFSRNAVCALLPATSGAEALDQDLSGLERARLVLLTESGVDARYAFRHALIREVVYGSQSFARRRELHARMAVYVQECCAGEQVEGSAGDLIQHAELLAHHYELAEKPLPAARYLFLSGHKAQARYAHAQAAGYYSRMLAILERVPRGKAEAEVALLTVQAREGQGDVALLTGDFAAAAAAYDAAHTGEVPTRLLIKLALVLPVQDRIEEAEAFARRAWADSQGPDSLAAAVTLAWLLWRAGNAEAGDWIEQGQALVARGSGEREPADDWAAGLAALLADLAGDWALARRAYLALNQPVGAALVACRQGDRCLREGDAAAALALYDQAAGLWEQEDDGRGLALARYRQAEAHRREENEAAARGALQEAADLLEVAPSASADDQAVVQQALTDMDGEGHGAWPAWQWRHYDDAFRISILFRP